MTRGKTRDGHLLFSRIEVLHFDKRGGAGSLTDPFFWSAICHDRGIEVYDDLDKIRDVAEGDCWCLSSNITLFLFFKKLKIMFVLHLYTKKLKNTKMLLTHL